MSERDSLAGRETYTHQGDVRLAAGVIDGGNGQSVGAIAAEVVDTDNDDDFEFLGVTRDEDVS